MAYLLVGVGGLGCELAKCIAGAPERVLEGIHTLHLVDFDTIEVSNLNRQLLFNSSHVGMAKAEVAKLIIENINPEIKVVCHITSISDPKFDCNFFKQMKLVINALDNNQARSYVSKMCIDAGVNLIDGGSAGYLGQVRWFFCKRDTECFNCYPTPPKKTYANCTIRNNPSEFVHCVVWAKHLFHALYGDDEGLDKDLFNIHNSDKNSTQFFTDLFNKIFDRDVKKLEDELSVNEDAVKFRCITKDDALNNNNLKEYVAIFEKLSSHFANLYESENVPLKWTKDDDQMVEYVYAVANLRAYVFNLPFKTEFETKTIAGNIIPSIVTTNAIVAGLMLTEIKKYSAHSDLYYRNVYLSSGPSNGVYISHVFIPNFNKDCLFCQDKIQMFHIAFDFKRQPISKNVIEYLKVWKIEMVKPEVMTQQGNILVSVDDEPDEIDEVFLDDSQLTIKLLCNDFVTQKRVELYCFNWTSFSNHFDGGYYRINESEYNDFINAALRNVSKDSKKSKYGS